MEKRSHRPKAFSSSTSNILAVMDGDGYKRSASEVDISRGFIPSDMKDPNKKKILDDLTKKIFLSSDEEKLRKKQIKQRPMRPKYFYEKNGNQFWNSASPTPAPLPETKQHRSQDKIHPQSKHQGVKVHPHRPPNMKLVMNPEGKLHDWTDLPKEEISELANVVSHHFSQTENDIQRNGGDNYSSYKDIFESRRNVFTNIMDNALMTPSHSSPQWNHNNNNRNMNLNYMNRTKQGPSVSNQNYIHRQQTGQPSSHLSHFPQSNYDILRSKTAPSLASTPKLPKRGGSKYVMPNYENRPSIEKFFV
ncbi:uncharacterized protein [Lepeophtheirus salmonis]|uniref:uncharacterized protein isoform X3 n=1 Tax=Lepeophtheirus salmonis TaxID=72036 RepID=UPI003AF39786